jgi:hypothetical protein
MIAVPSGGSTTATATPSAGGSGSPTDGAIVLTRTTLAGHPFRVVPVAGEWKAPHSTSRRKVRVEVARDGVWTPFPLPAVTDSSGRFTAFLNLEAPGRYQVRVVGNGGEPASAPATVIVR